MVPAAVLPLAAFPLGATGKVDVNALPDPFARAAAGTGERMPPANKAEAAAQRVWAGVLGVKEAPGVTDDFFAAGGSSLLAFRLAGRMQRDLGLPPFPPTLIFTTRTIRATLQALSGGANGGAAADLGAANGGSAIGAVASPILPKEWPDAHRPLSGSQEQMWMLQAAGQGKAYNMLVRWWDAAGTAGHSTSKSAGAVNPALRHALPPPHPCPVRPASPCHRSA